MNNFHISHEVKIHFSLVDRLRILFGSTCRMEVRIETNHEDVEVVSTKTDVDIEKIFKSKPIKMGGYSAIET